MTKMRVYELAKEAGVDSKVFTAQLKELGYNVKAYNSTLEEDVVQEIRTKVLGIVGQKVEEKRIDRKGGGTIIRRRTQVVRCEPEIMARPAAIEEGVEAIPGQERSFVAETFQETLSEPEMSSEAGAESVSAEGQVVPEVEVVGADGLSSDEKTVAVLDAEPVAEPEAKDLGEEPERPLTAEVVQPVSHEQKVDVKPLAAVSPKAPVVLESVKEIKPRKEFVKVIKKALVPTPVVIERRPKAPAAPAPRPQTVAEARVPVVVVEEVLDVDAASEDEAAASGRGKKSKRLVQIRQEPGPAAKVKKAALAKLKDGADIEPEEVAEIVGNLPVAGLRMRRIRRGAPKKKKKKAPLEAAQPKAIKRRIKIAETISVGDLARRMGIKASEVIAKLMELGVMAVVNQALDVDTATIVAADFGYEIEKGFFEEDSIISLDVQESGGGLMARPPVVTVMGHVDHGKTSILDAIRKTDVAAGEAGGITQHIGAHYVRSNTGDVVFLDTPGHAAFTAMRARGAQVTDIVVLVVAADDGVMEQTKEAVNHARAANVPIVVAINKIDKPNADPMKVTRELSELGLLSEEWGGNTMFCKVSAKKNIGIQELVDNILLQSEVMELKADPTVRARGHVLEAQLNKGRGPVATVLVQHGTLRSGDAFVCGQFYGKVRSLNTDKGTPIKEAGPCMPVEVHGISGVPQAGDEFIVLADEKMAKQVSAHRQLKVREAELATTSKISLDKLFEKMEEGKIKELKVILRADVQGTLEAFGEAISKLSTDAIKVTILHGGTGALTDTDILLASASDAIIIGFNVRANAKIQDLAQREKVDIRFYDVIYHAIDDIRKAMTGLLEPTYVEKVLGSAEVREAFHISKIGTIAGCYVTDGKIERGARVRLLRNDVVIFTGRISSLRRFKDDAREVLSGYECGIGIENYNDIKVGDVMEVFVMEEIASTL